MGDYRKLNLVTVPDRYPVPRSQDYSSNLHGKTIFSALDLHKVFHRIPLSPVDVPKLKSLHPLN